jgi:hypothetical protein
VDAAQVIAMARAALVALAAEDLAAADADLVVVLDMLQIRITPG